MGTTSASRIPLEHMAETHFSGHRRKMTALEVKHRRTYVQTHLNEQRTSELAYSCPYLLLELADPFNAFWCVESKIIIFQKVEDDPFSNFLGDHIPMFHSLVFHSV